MVLLGFGCPSNIFLLLSDWKMLKETNWCRMKHLKGSENNILRNLVISNYKFHQSLFFSYFIKASNIFQAGILIFDVSNLKLAQLKLHRSTNCEKK